eukprot:UN05703
MCSFCNIKIMAIMQHMKICFSPTFAPKNALSIRTNYLGYNLTKVISNMSIYSYIQLSSWL